MKSVLSLLLVAFPLSAQAPPGWKVRADDPKADMAKLSFAEMKPGFHVTTGPAVIPTPSSCITNEIASLSRAICRVTFLALACLATL